MSDSNAPWYIAIGSTIITALSSALTYLFKLLENENSKNIAKLETKNTQLEQKIDTIQQKADKCEDDRATLFSECNVLRNEVKHMQAKMQIIDTEGTKHAHRNEEK